jgi:hypothetical protein
MRPSDQFQTAGPNARAGVQPTIPQQKVHCERCEGRLNLGIFFDGTNNNRDRDLQNRKNSNVARLHALLSVFMLSYSLLLTACDRGAFANSNNEAAHDNSAPASVAGVHHLGRGHHIGEFSIDGRSCGNAGGPEKNSGGNTMCYLKLPDQWRPGIKHKVRWGVTNYTDDLQRLQKGNAGQWYEAEVELERFGVEVPIVEVHFYSNGVARIVPNDYAPPNEDTSPEQTPPLSEIPVAAPSWYFMGQTLAKQKHEKLTADDQFRLDRAQKNSELYFAFLERLWRSRGLSEVQVREKLDNAHQDAEGDIVGGYANYLTQLLRKLGYTKQQIEKIRADRPTWTRDIVNQKISYYMSQSGAKK